MRPSILAGFRAASLCATPNPNYNRGCAVRGRIFGFAFLWERSAVAVELVIFLGVRFAQFLLVCFASGQSSADHTQLATLLQARLKLYTLNFTCAPARQARRLCAGKICGLRPAVIKFRLSTPQARAAEIARRQPRSAFFSFKIGGVWWVSTRDTHTHLPNEVEKMIANIDGNRENTGRLASIIAFHQAVRKAQNVWTVNDMVYNCADPRLHVFVDVI